MRIFTVFISLAVISLSAFGMKNEDFNVDDCIRNVSSRLLYIHQHFKWRDYDFYDTPGENQAIKRERVELRELTEQLSSLKLLKEMSNEVPQKVKTKEFSTQTEEEIVEPAHTVLIEHNKAGKDMGTEYHESDFRNKFLDT